MIIKKIISGILKSQSYIIWCEEPKKGVVIDPRGNIKKNQNIINSNNLKIEYIFNTHFHADHTNGNRKIKKITGAKILIHKNDQPYLMKIFNDSKIFTFNMSLSPKPDLIINDEIEISIGNLLFKIYHTPGHTHGGLCFYSNGVLFTGDTLFVGDSGATNFKESNRANLGKSIKRLMDELPGNIIIYPGHDYGQTETSTLDWKKRNNINAKEYGYFVNELD